MCFEHRCLAAQSIFIDPEDGTHKNGAREIRIF